MYVHLFTVDLFLRKAADIIFGHENMRSGGLWLFQKISGPRARGAGSGFGMRAASFAGPSLDYM